MSYTQLAVTVSFTLEAGDKSLICGITKGGGCHRAMQLMQVCVITYEIIQIVSQLYSYIVFVTSTACFMDAKQTPSLNPFS